MSIKLERAPGLYLDDPLQQGYGDLSNWLSAVGRDLLQLPGAPVPQGITISPGTGVVSWASDMPSISVAAAPATSLSDLAVPQLLTPAVVSAISQPQADTPAIGGASGGGIGSQGSLLLVAGLANQTGPSLGTAVTSDPTIGGRAIDTVAVTSLKGSIDGGGTIDLTADLQSGGAFTLNTALLAALHGGSLPAGTHTLVLSATDASANTATTSVSFDLVTAPPVLSAKLANDTGASATDGFTSDDTITGSVTDAAGVVALFGTLDGKPAFADLTGSIGAGGTISITPAELNALAGGTLADGAHMLTLAAVDNAGNAATTEIDFTLQTSIGAPILALAGSDQATTPTSTTGSQITLLGNTTAGATATLTNTGAIATANTNGVFQLVGVPVNTSGPTALTVTVTDLAGNTNTGTLDVSHVAGSGGPDAVIEWDAITRQAITADADPPTVSSRAMAIESLSVYNAISAINGTPGYLDSLTAAPNTNAQAAVIAAADAALDGLYPGQAAAFDAQATADLAAIPDGPGKAAGIALGKAAAAGMLALRANDGSTANVTAIGSEAVGQWRPTAPAYAPATTPQWATVTPFALQSPSQFLPTPPPPIGSQAYADAVNITESLGEANSTTRTADETQAAKFWNDQTGTDTPPGQWDSIAAVVAQAAGASLIEDARLFAELNVAEADASIAAWNGKFTYNAWRPITLFRDPGASGNAAIQGNPNWSPLIVTPNFPEYPEGHGTFSGAAAAILASFFGDATSFTVTSESTPGVFRSFTSFSQAAAEAAMSRIWGGIHFTFSADAALTLGQEIGAWTLGAFNAGADTTPPKVTLNIPANTTTNLDPIITGQVSSSFGVEALSVTIDGGPAATVPLNPDGSFSFAVPVAIDGSADGTHSVNFIATDPAGNRSPQASYNFNLITKAPTITLAADSVKNGGAMGAGAALDGSVGLPTGDALLSLSYAFDGGAPVSVVVGPTGSFDAPLDLTHLAPGPHVLRLTATDLAGNVTAQALAVSYTLAPLTLTAISPTDGSSDVGVTFRPSIEFSRPVDTATLTTSSFFATDSTGALLPATVVPFTDGTGAWLLLSNPVAGASVITLHVQGPLIKAAADGAELDAADSGVAGSTLTESYSTVSSASVTGTTISGIVVDPGPDGTPLSPDDLKAAPDGTADFAHDSWKLPIAGAKVYVLGQEQNAVFTAADGSFTLTNVPVGDVKVVVDGTTATNDPAGFYFPEMVLDTQVRAGVVNTIPGGMGTPQQQAAMAADPAVYLPRVATNILTTVSTTGPTTVSAPANADVGSGGFTMTPQQLAELTLTVQPNSIVDANGNPVSNAQVGLAPVPPSIVMDMLPAGLLQHSFDITIQAPGGAVFNAAATLTMPNVFGLAPGQSTYVLAFDHTTGRLVIQGTATASADGLTVTTNANSGVMAPGWHGMTPPGSNGNGQVGDEYPATLGAAYKDFLQAEGQANPTAMALVGQANNVINTTSNVWTVGSGTVGAAGGNVGALGHFGNGLSAGADAYNLGNNLGNNIHDVATHPTDPGAYIQLAGQLILDGSNLALDAGGYIPGPAGEIASGARAATAGIGLIQDGIDGNLPTLQTQVNTVTNSNPFSTLSPGGKSFSIEAASATPFDAIVASVEAEAAYQLPFWQRMYTDLTTLSVLDEIDHTKPDGGLTSGEMSALNADMPAIQAAALDYADAVQHLVGHPTLPALIAEVVDGVSTAITTTNAAFFLPIRPPAVVREAGFSGGIPVAGIASVGIFAAAATPPASSTSATTGAGDTIYAAVQAGDGSVQRISFTASQGYNYFFAPNTYYQITLYDPTTNEIGEAFFKSAPSGQDTAIPLAGLVPDTATPGADGLSANAAFAIGVNNANPSNLVPGITDLSALQQGLYNGSVLPGTTGIVASLPLQGSAQAVVLAGSLIDPLTTYAFVATGSYGLAILDVSNAFRPVVLSQLQLSGGNATGIAVSTSLGVAAVATGAGGLQFVDITTPSAPTLLTTVPIAATAVQTIGGIAYANSGTTLDSFDLATGTLLQTLPLGGGTITGIAVQGSTIYTMDSSNTLRVLDVSSGAMVQVGSVGLPAGGNGLVAANGVVYVAAANGNSTGDYLTVNVSNPAAPVLIEGVDNPGMAGAALALNGSGVGVAVQTIQEPPPNPGLHNVADLFNASDATKTGQLQTRFELPAPPSAVAIGEGIAFIADGSSGVQVLNYLAPDTTGVPPTVSISTPPVDVDPATSGIQVYEGAPLSIGITVADNVQVRNVELLVNGTVAANAVSFPFDLTANMPTISANGGGSVTVQVQAVDTGGNITISTPTQVQLVPDTRPLNLLSESISEGAVLSQFVRSISLTFSKPVNPATITSSSVEVLDQHGSMVAASSIAMAADNQVVKLNFGTLAVGSYKLVVDAPLVADFNGVTLGASALTTDFVVQSFSAIFTNQGGGSWNTASNWNINAVPGAADSVYVGNAIGAPVSYDGNTDSVAKLVTSGGGLFQVTGGQLNVTSLLEVGEPFSVGGGGLSSSGTTMVDAGGLIAVNNRSTGLNNLAIAAGGAVQVANNNWLVASGTLANAGSIGLNSVGNDTRLIVSGSVTLSGGGALVLSDNANNNVFGAAAGAVLSNAGNTISGAGTIGDGVVALVNQAGGTIDATGGGNSLVLTGGLPVSNAGLLEDTGPAGLLILNTAVTNTGTIAALGVGSHVDLRNASITGGLFTTANGAAIRSADRGSVLDNVTIAAGATFVVLNNEAISLQDTLTNHGTLVLNSVGNYTAVQLGGTVTLNGGGTLLLTDNPNNSINGGTLLTNVDNTISGGGVVGANGLTLVNQSAGTINASGGSRLQIATTAMTNAGLLEATGPGGLLITGTPMTNTGTISAPLAGSHVDLQSAAIIGGVLTTANGGVIQQVDRGSLLDNVTLASNGQLVVLNNEYLALQDTLTNQGTLALNSAGNDTRLDIVGTVTLTGNGALQLSDNPNNHIFSNGTSAVLVNANNVIAGGGLIGDFSDALLAVVNSTAGVIDANGSNAVTIGLGGGTLANFGLLESTGTGGGNQGLQIVNSVIDNTGSSNAGIILSTGTNSHVDLQSAVISGGTLETSSGGVIQELDRGSVLGNVVLAAGGTLSVINNEAINVQDILTNHGTLELNSTGNYTAMQLAGTVTLSGGGALLLSDNPNNFINGGALLTNVDNTISGSGAIGANGLTVINQAGGTINATGGNRLQIVTAAMTNAGLLEATGPGGLLITGTPVTNSGTISAPAAGSHVDLQSATITGGVLSTANGGVIQEVDRGSLLDNLTLASGGQLLVTDNSFLALQDSLTNKGTLALNSSGNDTRLAIVGTVTLTGTGAVQFTDNANNHVFSNGAAAVLVNRDNVISGDGMIGDSTDALLAVVNGTAGVIDASGGNALVIGLGGGTLANVGLLEATATSAGNQGLQISNSVIDNTGSSNAGAILSTGSNSHVDLVSATIVGGALETAAGGVFQAVNRTSTLDNVALATDAQVVVTNNNFLQLLGTLINHGTLAMASVGSDTQLLINGSVTLNGGGALLLSDNTNNHVYNAAAGSVLTNVDNVIAGAGQLGDGGLSLVNQAGGTINASGGNQLVITGGNLEINAGLLEATGSGGLRIAGTPITNTGTIAAPVAGSHVDLASATITGGTLTTANGGVIQAVDRGSLLDGMTIAAGASVLVTNNNWLSIDETLTNKGVILLSSVGNDTRLLIAGNATLAGGGSVQLSDNGNNSIVNSVASTLLDNQDNTIAGAGNIGQGNMTITNGALGTIEATGGNTLFVNTGGNVIGNAGLLESAGGGGLNIGGGGGVANTGTIWANGNGLYVAGDISGTGAERITGATTLQLGGSIAAGQTISFDSGSTGTLRLDDSQQFNGHVAGLATDGSNALDLSDISFIGGTTKATFSGDTSGGTLTVTDGSHAANLILIGDYTSATFVPVTDNHNGTKVVDPTAPGGDLLSSLLYGGGGGQPADLLLPPWHNPSLPDGGLPHGGAGAVWSHAEPWGFVPPLASHI